MTIAETLNGVTIISLELDATLAESMTHTAIVTEHPVEEGSNIADHVRVEPVKLSLEGMVTNHAVVPTLINLNWTKVEDTYSIFRKWQTDATRLTVKTSLDTYEDMILKSFTIKRSGPASNNILPVSVEFQHIETATSAISGAKAPKPKIKKAEPKETKPKKPPQQKVAVAKQLSNAVTKLFK